MYTGKLVFAQLMGHLPLHTFRRCVARYSGNRKVQRFARKGDASTTVRLLTFLPFVTYCDD